MKIKFYARFMCLAVSIGNLGVLLRFGGLFRQWYFYRCRESGMDVLDFGPVCFEWSYPFYPFFGKEK